MQETINYKLKKPDVTDNVNINDINTNMDVIDEEIKRNVDILASKVDKVEGKGLSANDFTDVEKNKLQYIEPEANNYVHPEKHLASIIIEDSEHRFVTDEEKENWNGKGDASELNKIQQRIAESYTQITELEQIIYNINTNVQKQKDEINAITDTVANNLGSIWQLQSNALRNMENMKYSYGGLFNDSFIAESDGGIGVNSNASSIGTFTQWVSDEHSVYSGRYDVSLDGEYIVSLSGSNKNTVNIIRVSDGVVVATFSFDMSYSFDHDCIKWSAGDTIIGTCWDSNSNSSLIFAYKFDRNKLNVTNIKNIDINDVRFTCIDISRNSQTNVNIIAGDHNGNYVYYYKLDLLNSSIVYISKCYVFSNQYAVFINYDATKAYVSSRFNGLSGWTYWIISLDITSSDIKIHKYLKFDEASDLEWMGILATNKAGDKVVTQYHYQDDRYYIELRDFNTLSVIDSSIIRSYNGSPEFGRYVITDISSGYDLLSFSTNDRSRLYDISDNNLTEIVSTPQQGDALFSVYSNTVISNTSKATFYLCPRHKFVNTFKNKILNFTPTQLYVLREEIPITSLLKLEISFDGGDNWFVVNTFEEKIDIPENKRGTNVVARVTVNGQSWSDTHMNYLVILLD
ncbi:hypothetical protein [Abyssisolibacter fermentans]|uniref:hypothetical protein n=1 Tax=Abyssisolibacter fermentans TaxID=1766203 RepID=UPI000A9C7814|nr:hypothetical protein [Abyssisolibacter fermentans]